MRMTTTTDLKRFGAVALAAAVLCFAGQSRAEEKKAAGAPGQADAVVAGAATPNTLSDKEKADGWKLLFDGKTIDHFRGYKKQDVPKGWQVVDGAMVCKKGGDLVTKDQYASF